MSLTKPRAEFKPFEYPWAYEAWSQQQKIHWIPEEVSLGDDIKDWKFKLTIPEKHIVTQIFRFFTQADVEVGKCYMQHYTNVFKPIEILMMLTSFSNMETVHMAAYSYLLDTIGMPETEYKAFLKYEEMEEKRRFLTAFQSVSDSANQEERDHHLALTMVVFGAFTEGMQLFSSFAILLNFQRFNKLKGVGQIIAWSIRDETLHTASIIKLFKEYIVEKPYVWNDKLKNDILDACIYMVGLEDKFIDLVFEMGDIEGITASDLKLYIRFVANRRLQQIGLDPHFDVDSVNPLEWLEECLNGMDHTNFFENRVTEYTRAATTGEWHEAEYE